MRNKRVTNSEVDMSQMVFRIERRRVERQRMNEIRRGHQRFEEQRHTNHRKFLENERPWSWASAIARAC